MSSGFEPLSDPWYFYLNINPRWEAIEGWLSQDAAMFPSENASMQKHLLLLLVKHIDLQVHKTIGTEKTVFLSLDVL